MRMEIAFYRELDGNMQKTTGGVLIPMRTASDTINLHVNGIASTIPAAVDNQ